MDEGILLILAIAWVLGQTVPVQSLSCDWTGKERPMLPGGFVKVQHAAPLPAFIHTLPVRVYYEDTDFSGAVYHASYLRFMERGRTEFLRAKGMGQGASLISTGFGFVVRAMQINFLKAARMDDELMVETRLGDIGGASLIFHQRVTRSGEAMVEAEVKIAAVKNGRATRLPSNLQALTEGGA